MDVRRVESSRICGGEWQMDQRWICYSILHDSCVQYAYSAHVDLIFVHVSRAFFIDLVKKSQISLALCQRRREVSLKNHYKIAFSRLRNSKFSSHRRPNHVVGRAKVGCSPTAVAYALRAALLEIWPPRNVITTTLGQNPYVNRAQKCFCNLGHPWGSFTGSVPILGLGIHRHPIGRSSGPDNYSWSINKRPGPHAAARRPVPPGPRRTFKVRLVHVMACGIVAATFDLRTPSARRAGTLRCP